MINNNRQAGRRRGRGGQQQRPQGNSGARDNGNRIDNRSRGNAAQLLEKYKSLARDAQQAGDRVNTEYYLQFADHYFRVLAETRSRFEENRTPMQGGANTFQDDEQDYNDEGEPVPRAEPPRQTDGQNGGQRPEQGRDGQEPRRDRQEGRQDGNRDRDRDGNRQESRQSNSGQQGYPGERQSEGSRGTQNSGQDRASGDRQYDEDRPRRQNNDQAPDRYVRDRNRYQTEDRAPAQPDDAPVEQSAVAEEPRADEQEAPRRRGRPRREPALEAAPAFEADCLPPSLIAAPVVESAPANDTADAEPEEKPRRRRGRPPASETAGV